jgi:mono/diheme cytochrome c family protein
MKSQLYLPLFLLMVCALACSSGKSVSSSELKSDTPIPSDVHKIMVTSCLACHGEAGKAMAKAAVKMSDWGSYTAKKQASKAKAMCKMVTKGKMPPKGYLNEHPEAKLTPEQIATICNWSAELNKKK